MPARIPAETQSKLQAVRAWLPCGESWVAKLPKALPKDGAIVILVRLGCRVGCEVPAHATVGRKILKEGTAGVGIFPMASRVMRA